MACPFCNRRSDIWRRVFYKDAKKAWFAFLDAHPYTKGHVILAALKQKGPCPQEFDPKVFHFLGGALCDVERAMRKCYPHMKHVLFASLRGDVKHFHIHLLPLWPEEEACWRKITGYSDAHFMEFIGLLEKRRDFRLLNSQLENALKKAKLNKGNLVNTLRRESIKGLSVQIKALRKITGFKSNS
jgi:diadenosine tetraphosphate (Ap4A) HIT family hydrolase